MTDRQIDEMVMSLLREADYDLSRQYEPTAKDSREASIKLNILRNIVKKHMKVR